MRALVCSGYGNGENLRLEERPVPEPGKGEIRVRVLACGANASDWEYVTGFPAYARIVRFFSPRVDVFGSDIVGRVEACGPGANKFQPGDRVLADTMGLFRGFADQALAPERLWVPIPDEIDDVTAASLPQSGTIALTAFRGRLHPSDKVLINGGGGGSGPLAIQMARAAGAEVWAVDNGDKLAVMTEAGAHHVLDYRQQDFLDLPQRFNLILDLWGTRPIRKVRQVLAPSGRYFLVGGPMPYILGAFATSLWSRFTNRRAGLLMVHQGPGDLHTLLQMVADGSLRPFVGQVAPLEDAASALQDMGAGKISGKLVIRP